MNNDYVLLAEKEEIWARMLMEVLEDNGIPCASRSVYGAGFTIRTGTQDILKVYVPAELLERANEMMDELFNAEAEE